VVIDDFHLVGTVIPPDEADTPLVVDPNAVLALTVTAQGLQAVTAQGGEVPQGYSLVEAVKAKFCLFPYAIEARYTVAFVQRLGVLAAE
jgi:hypothetical protein